MPKNNLEDTTTQINSLKFELKRFKELQSEVDDMWSNLYETDYFNGRNRPLSQRLISRFSTLYLIAKLNKIGLKRAYTYSKDYKTIKSNHLLDIGYYLNNNKDIRLSGKYSILHYILHGFEEDRQPNPTFNANYYINAYTDVKNSKLNPLVHHSLYGLKEGRKTNQEHLKRILYVVHQGEGGTQFTNEDLMKHTQKDFIIFFLTSDSRTITLWKYEDSKFEFIKSWRVKSNWSAKNFYNNEFSKIYMEILVKYKIDIVHIRHLLLHTFDLVEVINLLEIPLILSFHDFYFICPCFTLLDENNIYCGSKCTPGDGQCNILMNVLKDLPVLKTFVNEWREEVSAILARTTAIVTTSEVVKQIFISTYPQLAYKDFRIIEHGRDFQTNKNPSNSYETPSNDRVTKILIPGDINTHKGADLIKKIKKEDINSNLEFHFIGRIRDDLMDYGIYHGEYKREDFYELVHNIKPSFIGIFSIWPETYCHTLSEAWSCGVPVLTTKIGVLEARVNENGGGWLLDYKNPSNAYKKIMEVIDSPVEYAKVAEQAKKITFKNTQEMGDEYLELYKQYLK